MNPLFTAGLQASRHAILRFVSVVCVGLVIAGLWFAVDKAFIHPRKQESYQQKAETIQNYETHNYLSDKELLFLGIKLWKARVGISIK